MITNKTLKYSHSKTCGIVKPDKTTINQPPEVDIPVIIKAISTIKQPHDGDIPVINIKPISAIKQRRTVNKTPVSGITIKEEIQVVPISFDEQRTNYYINVKQQKHKK